MFYSIVLAVIVGIWVVFFLRRKHGLKGKIIPGPRGFPLIGCVLEVNDYNFYFKLIEYADRFGDIIRFKMFSENCVVLNSKELIHKAFKGDKYKRHFNDRFRTFFGEYCRFHHQSLVFAPEGFGLFHKAVRKEFIKALPTYGRGRVDFEQSVLVEMDLLIKRIENTPGLTFKCVDMFGRSLANTMSLVLCGELLPDDDSDSDVLLQHTSGGEFFVSHWINFIMSSFPFLRFLPWRFGQEYKQYKSVDKKLRQKYFYDLKKTYTPTKLRGFVDHFIDEQRKERESGNDVFFTDELIITLIAEVIDSGITSTRTFLTNAMLILTNYPEIQIKIQAELDRVIGKERTPTYLDRKECHYLWAFQMELHRYLPIAPTLFPHFCQEHIEFCGYDIEPNTTVLANIWYVQHDKEIWGDPWTFRPERFLDDKGKPLPRDHKRRKSVLVFGYGRRQCVGEIFAKTRIFLYLATLLQRWSFEFPKGMEKSCDPRTHGCYDMKGLFKANPFVCMAKERSASIERVTCK